MDAAAVGAVVGALVALLGSVATEAYRRRSDYRQWQFEKLMELYAELMQHSRAARGQAHRAGRSGRTELLDEEAAKRFRQIAASAELLASPATVAAIRRVMGLMHEDHHAAELRIARRSDPAAATHHGREHVFSTFADWHKERDSMHNAFRHDLGMPPLKLQHRLNHEKGERLDDPLAVDAEN